MHIIPHHMITLKIEQQCILCFEAVRAFTNNPIHNPLHISD